MAQSEETRRRLALGATVVICLFVFTLWLGQTSHTVAITMGDAEKADTASVANSPFTVIKNLGTALSGIFTGSPLSTQIEREIEAGATTQIATTSLQQ